LLRCAAHRTDARRACKHSQKTCAIARIGE
jgi:hypothetical protein